MDFTPKMIVEELDKYIIGQQNAKRAVAIALRNRYRRSKLSKDIREEITPKNIIMRGPTGVGKTEIARRLAKIVNVPFIKIEATKYTEVGYVGRDVESMVRDLVEVAVRMVKDEKVKEVEKKVEPIVENRIVDAIFEQKKNAETTKEEILKDFQAEKLEDEYLELEVLSQPKSLDLSGGVTEINLGSMFDGIFPGGKKKKRKLSVRQAREIITQEESEKLIDLDNVNAEAIRRAEEDGIIFIDEIDKIIGKGSNANSGPDVSREGVQRDILPIVEGSTVSTKYGNLKTDYIFFIAAGAFHVAKLEDMIPELQGRFPVRVDLDNLTKEDFKKILKQPKNAVTLQYGALLKVDNIDLKFSEDSIDEIAEVACNENSTSENLGARRLHTVMEKLLSDISFNANGEHPMTELLITKEYVQNVFSEEKSKFDLKKYIL